MNGQTLYFEDVEEGQEIPGYSLLLDSLRMHLQSSGTQDFHRQHNDEQFANKQGAAHMFVNTAFTQAAMSRLVTDWMGDDGWLQKFEMQMRKMNFPGDTMTMKGKAAKKYIHDRKGVIECELWIENQREGVTTVGKATVILPVRASS